MKTVYLSKSSDKVEENKICQVAGYLVKIKKHNDGADERICQVKSKKNFYLLSLMSGGDEDDESDEDDQMKEIYIKGVIKNG